MTAQATRCTGPLESAASEGLPDRWKRPGDKGYPRQRPRKTTFGCALNAQRISATFKDRLTSVEGRVWGTMGKEKGRLKTLSSGSPCQIDDPAERFAKTADWAWKGVMPNAPWIPGSYSFESIRDAAAGAPSQARAGRRKPACRSR